VGDRTVPGGAGAADALEAAPLAEPGSPEWKRLRWRAGRRGMKELDVLFARYLEHGWPTADAAERRAFLALLELQDPELARLVLARAGVVAEDPARAALVEKLTDGRYARLPA